VFVIEIFWRIKVDIYILFTRKRFLKMPVSTFLLVIASCDIGICDNHSLVSVLRRRVS